MLREVFGIEANDEAETIVFVGDSPNDAPMFSFFANAVGVANVLRFKETLSAAPRWVTAEPSAPGFAELVRLLPEVRA